MRYLQNALLLIATLLMVASAQAQRHSKITLIYSDPDGTPIAATDDKGNLEWRVEYQPFGREVANTSQDRSSDISYAAKPYDEEIGLSYFGGRWYDPDSGRFTGIDPMPVQFDDFKTFNRYAYGFNNPYKYVDPDGNFAFLIPLAIWAGKGLAVAGAGLSGHAIGSSSYDLYSGRKTVGEAATSAAIGVAEGALLKGAGGALVKVGRKIASKPFVPDEYWGRNAPSNITPGTKRLDHTKLNTKTGELEQSRVTFDDFGRQNFRVDKTNHGRPTGNGHPNDSGHSSPHLHESTYAPRGTRGHNQDTGRRETSHNFNE